jgi:hypothetical protein
MNRYREMAARVLRAYGVVAGFGEQAPDSMVDVFASVIERRFGTPVLPRADETVAVTLDTPRTAALFFDRIWQPPAIKDFVPQQLQELIVFGATDTEIWSLVGTLAMGPPLHLDWQKMETIFGADTPVAELWARRGTPTARIYSEVLTQERGIRAVPIYESMGNWERDYRPGSSEVIVAALHGLGIISESDLDWAQVLEFRNDISAKTKLRRLRHWVDSTMLDKPLSYVRDELAIRLDDYEWALKKHGIKTVTGTVAELLDPKFLAGVAASSAGLALAGADFWAAVGAAGALVGRVALSVTTRLVDLAEAARSGSDVAVIHEIKQLGAKSKK